MILTAKKSALRSPLIPVKYATNYFYHSDLDRRTIEGILAKGNKAKALKLHNGGVKTFVSPPPPPPVACHTAAGSYLTSQTTQNINCVSNDVVASYLCEQNTIHGRDIVKSTGIVSQENNGVKHNKLSVVNGVEHSVQESIVSQENKRVKDNGSSII